MALTAGQRLGVYEVIGPIGAGGMGEVYRARDTRLGRDVALKVLPEMFAADPERLARFEREAQLLAALNHPHIAGIHGLEEGGAVRALVMELIEGDTLAERIAGTPMPLEEGLAIARQIAEALEAAHEQGIIHRDLKPANIKVTPAGVVKVLDFGLAKLNDPSASNDPNRPNSSMSPTVVSPAMTTVGVLLGTAAYMAPEQARGRPTDRRVDVWAFGCVLFEMLTGQHAFPGSDVTEVLATVLKTEPDWKALPSSTPPRIRSVLERCLQKDPKLRIRDIGDVRLAMEGAFETVAAAAVPASIPLPRRGWGWPVSVVAVALAAGLLTWFVSRPSIDPVTPTRFSLVLPDSDQLPFAAGTMVGVSPDGQTLAYRASRAGNMRLFVRRIDQFEAQAIGDAPPGEAPFFSPDGEWVAYFSNNALRKVSVRGGPPETIAPLTDNFRGGDWSPEGTIVLAGGALITLPATGGTPTTLATAPDGRRFWYPQIVAGGRAMLYTTSGPRPDAGDIEVLDVATKTSRKLLPGAAGRLLPTGHLVFIRSGTLWAVKFNESSLQLEGTPVPVVEGIRVEAGGAIQYTVGRDGTLIYIPGAPVSSSQLVWIDRAGTEAPVGVPPRAFFSVRLDSTSRLAALDVRDSGADGTDIWVLPLGRQTPTRVTFEAADDALPAWMPDGRVVFTSTRNGSAAIFAQAADGTGKAVQLAGASGAAGAGGNTLDQAAVSPDGKFLVARSNEDIVIASMDDKTVRKLIESPFRERNPEISRDGHWIAYQSDESGIAEVYVRPFPDVGKGKWQVSEKGGTRPVWAHNRKELFYAGPESTLMSAAFSVTGDAFVPSTATRLARLPLTPGAHRAFDVAADDQRFLTIKGEISNERAEIRVVQNWFEELKKRVP
jgi:eukaryotic-like serine/threonine-protein kinase